LLLFSRQVVVVLGHADVGVAKAGGNDASVLASETKHNAAFGRLQNDDLEDMADQLLQRSGVG
jgi:hypothetical protein